MAEPLGILLLWHMHQPSYFDPDTGRSLMPWVRLHAIKDYYDMAQVISEVDGAKAVFNFVPSLWEQLFRIGQGEWLDEHEILSRKHEEDLTPQERLFVAEHFFAANARTMIAPYARYHDLQCRYGSKEHRSRILDADVQTLRDIIVWFHLAWSGHTLRQYPFVQRLFEKRSGFSYEEKIELLDIQRGLIRTTFELYRGLAEKGSIEISATPFYHPILPLLLDPDSAHVACPGMALPKGRFSVEDDAEEQVRRAVDYHTKLFGVPPKGFWPAEGSVSPKAASVFARHDLRWIATDEDVLRLSLGSGQLTNGEKYRPYQFGGIRFFFRDHDLSDRIGFRYQGMNAHDAVNDFVNRLKEIRQSLPPNSRFVVPVILDGENCWEFFEDQGRPFLLELYRRLAEDPELKPMTACEALDFMPSAPNLERLHSGSWIYANFTTWVGDPVKNEAWTLLYETLRKARNAVSDGRVPADKLELLKENILAAEGSDWFWWFGEGHSSEYDAMFDSLFRKRLRAIYRICGLAVPERLMKPVDDRSVGQRGFTVPFSFIRPKLSGRRESYWEWLSAGSCSPGGGSMQKIDNRVGRLLYGFDEGHFYFRVESPLLQSGSYSRSSQVEIIFDGAAKQRFSIPLEGGGAQDSGLRSTIGEALEVQIPFDALGSVLKPGDAVEFFVAWLDEGRLIERLPDVEPVVLSFPSKHFDEENWLL